MAMFPPEEQGIVRTRLAESLHAVVSQRLLPKRDGKGRVVAAEVMVVTPTIRELILEGERVAEIRDYMADGREQYGSQTFDQHLADLVDSGEVSFEVAMANASRPSDFALRMRTLGGGRSGGEGGPPGSATPTGDGSSPGALEGASTNGFDFLGS
jgi:twitching motility protein PilT